MTCNQAAGSRIKDHKWNISSSSVRAPSHLGATGEAEKLEPHHFAEHRIRLKEEIRRSSAERNAGSTGHVSANQNHRHAGTVSKPRTRIGAKEHQLASQSRSRGTESLCGCRAGFWCMQGAVTDSAVVLCIDA